MEECLVEFNKEGAMERLIKEEKEVELKRFNEVDLARMARFLMKRTEESVAPLTVRITKNDQILFHYVANNCAADKDNWVRRKTNSVLNFGHSTLWLYYKTDMNTEQLVEKYGLSKDDYTISAGAVPIMVRGVGMVGVLAASGYSGLRDDHDLCIQALNYVKGEMNNE